MQATHKNTNFLFSKLKPTRKRTSHPVADGRGGGLQPPSWAEFVWSSSSVRPKNVNPRKKNSTPGHQWPATTRSRVSLASLARGRSPATARPALALPRSTAAARRRRLFLSVSGLRLCPSPLRLSARPPPASADHAAARPRAPTAGSPGARPGQ